MVSHLDQQLGPFDEEELKIKWLKGDFLPIDYVYDDAKQDWILLAERFAWAAAKLENASPPPIRNDIVKRRRPPDPPTTKPAILEISGDSVLKEWKKPIGQGAKVKLVDGIGEIDFAALPPGQVELVLQDSSSSMLKLQEPLKVQVRSAEPQQITWAFATSQVVGQDIELTIKAVDAAGTVCTHYSDQFIIRIDAKQSQNVDVFLKEGTATVKFNHTKAEPWKIALAYSGSRPLKLPEAKDFEWHPGPAVKLILDGPGTLTAGQPLKVQVKAVDAFGNLAKTFQGTVILDVKAS